MVKKTNFGKKLRTDF